MTYHEINVEFLDQLVLEMVNQELREIWAASTQHDKFFEVDSRPEVQ